MTSKNIVSAIKKYSLVLLFAAITFGFVALKSRENKKEMNTKKVEVTCVQVVPGINLIEPEDADKATLQETYMTSLSDCGFDLETLCQICFNPEDFVLDANGIPDFEDTSINNVELKSFIEANKGTIALDGAATPIGPSGTLVTLYYRAVQ